MENKWHTCDRCSKTLSSYRSLWRHKQKCPHELAPYIPTFDGSEFGTDKTKSKETMDELKRFVLGEPPRKTARIESSTSQDSLEQKQNLPTKLLDEYAKPKSLSELYNDNVKRNHDNDNDDDEDDDDDHDDDDDDDDVNDDEDRLNDNDDDDKLEETSVKLLPITRIGLEKRFSKLFHEFTKQKKLENRPELMLLLDAMLRHEYITLLEYESFNTVLEDSPPLAKVREKDDIWKLIQSTTRELIKNDKEEVSKLIDNFKSKAGEDFIDSVLELEKSVEQFIDGKATLSSIIDISRSLENSSLLLSDQIRLRMLLNDIADNRQRVQAILRRLKDNGRDENTLKQLVREQLLSPEQYEKLNAAAAAIDLTAIADIIKDTKVGRGLKFLPRTVDDLKKKVQVLLKEIATKGIDATKKELIAILDELLHKDGITKNEYTSINNDIKKGEGWGYYGYLL